MKSSMKIAFCGILSALSTVLMFLTGVIPVATLAIPAIAGCLLIAAVVEVGVRWAFGVYVVCCALGVLLAPDREAFLFYALFFGYYPVLYAVLGRIKRKPLRYGTKFLVFNAAMVLEAVLSLYVLGIPMETIRFLGPYTPVALLALANLVFLLYDHALDGLILLYLHRIHPQVKRLFPKG